MLANARRLAAAVKARRAELDLNQLEVWAHGGPSNTTQTKVENGELGTLTRTTARKIDAGLKWEPGSAKRVWLGEGEATPILDNLRGHESKWLRELIAASEDVDEATKAELLEVLRKRGVV